MTYPNFPYELLPVDGTEFLIPDWTVLSFRGDDAQFFLHNQLTTDIKGQALNTVHLSGLCTHKGRLLATPWVYRHADGIYMIVPRDIAERLLAHLKKFVMRSKVNIAQESYFLYGQIHQEQTDLMANPAINIGACENINQRHVLLLPSRSGPPRTLIIAENQVQDPLIKHESNHEENLKNSVSLFALWRMVGIYAGIPEIGHVNQEQFIPQSVNLELLEAVNFKKGCYPGQEIVARTHYLSEPKRRAFFVTASASLTEGADVSNSQGEVVGRVINAQFNNQSQISLHWALIELKLDYQEAVLSSSGVSLTRY